MHPLRCISICAAGTDSVSKFYKPTHLWIWPEATGPEPYSTSVWRIWMNEIHLLSCFVCVSVWQFVLTFYWFPLIILQSSCLSRERQVYTEHNKKGIIGIYYLETEKSPFHLSPAGQPPSEKSFHDLLNRQMASHSYPHAVYGCWCICGPPWIHPFASWRNTVAQMDRVCAGRALNGPPVAS